MDLLSAWKSVRDDHFVFDLSLLCQSQHKSIAPMMETYTIALERADDTLQWRVNENELEAIVGLWTWSLLKSDPKWLQEGLGRTVGLTEFEARAPDTDLYFHKWIFRQTEARMVSSQMVSFPQQLFGYFSDEYPNDKEILVVRTKNKVEKMVAQDIYIHFLQSALEGLAELGGEINILPGSQNRLVAHNSRIDDLVECFESSGLGSREDALLCIVPSLRNRGLLPELAADSRPIRLRLEELIGSKKWSDALSIANWVCERSAGEEFEHSANELGYICLQAMADDDSNVQTVGYDYAISAMQSDPRSFLLKNMSNQRPADWFGTNEEAEIWANYTRQLGWLAWHFADKSSNKLHIRRSLEAYGVHGSSIPSSNVNACERLGQQGQQIVLEWLATSNGGQFQEESYQLALNWVCQNGHHALLNWLVDRCVELRERVPSFPFRFILWSAEGKHRLALALLQRRDVSLDTQDPFGQVAPIITAITKSNYNAVRELLEAGADVNLRGSRTETPLMVASYLGDARIVALLLQHGAQVNAQNQTGISPLIACAAAGHVDVAQTLLDHGADINLTNCDGCSALLSAASEDQIEMMRLLLSRGADINAQSESGQTALMLTAENRSTAAMEILLAHGADVHRRNCYDETAWDSVCRKYDSEEIQCLEGMWPGRGRGLVSQ
jgi:ankyrin repeat protein